MERGGGTSTGLPAVSGGGGREIVGLDRVGVRDGVRGGFGAVAPSALVGPDMGGGVDRAMGVWGEVGTRRRRGFGGGTTRREMGAESSTSSSPSGSRSPIAGSAPDGGYSEEISGISGGASSSRSTSTSMDSRS